MPVVKRRCTLSVRAIVQGIMFGLGSLLINVMSNDISSAEQKHSSVLMIIVSYMPLSIATLFLWCVVNHFFIEPVELQPQETGHLIDDQIPPGQLIINIHHADQDTGRLDPQHIERVDPQGQGCLHVPQDTPRLNDHQERGRAHEQQQLKETGSSSSDHPSVVSENEQFRLLVSKYYLRRHFGENGLAGFLDRKASASFPPRAIPISAWAEQISYYINLTAPPAQAQLMKDDIIGKEIYTKQPVASDVGAAASQSGGVTLPEDSMPGPKVLRRRKSNR